MVYEGFNLLPEKTTDYSSSLAHLTQEAKNWDIISLVQEVTDPKPGRLETKNQTDLRDLVLPEQLVLHNLQGSDPGILELYICALSNQLTGGSIWIKAPSSPFM